MSTETHTVSDDQVRDAFQRWKNLEEEKARISEDLKELFAEQKAFGHDTKAMRAAFRLKVKMDEARPEDAEHEALVDTYLAALEAPRASRAYAREKIGEFCSDAGLNIVTKHTEITASSAEAAVTADDDLREPVAAEQGQIIREGDAPHETDRFGGDASCPDTEFQMDRATEGSFETGSEAAEKGREAIPAGPEGVDLNHAGAGESPATDITIPSADGDAAANAGGTDVARSATRAGLADPTSNTGEGAANTALPAKSSIRPLCRNPGETCGGYGRKHCRACEMAAAELEAAE